MKIWIAGFGNEYREDDGAGVILAARLGKFLSGVPGAEVSLCLEHQLLPELADELKADIAIFCDASAATSEDGFSIREISPDPRLDGFNIHSMGPEWLLALAAQLGTSPKKALLVTVSGESFDFSDTPTPVCLERIASAEEAFKKYWGRLLGK